MGEGPDLEPVCALADREAGAAAAAGQLSAATVDALGSAGLFKAFLPEDLGGGAMALPEMCSVIARLAEADGATGWAVMIGAGPNWFAGHMSPALASEVFAPANTVVAGSGIPGTAKSTHGGWRVDGHWRWCSGAPWATWFTFTAAPSRADTFAFAVPASDVQLDRSVWDVRGLRATASWDAVLDGVTVATRRTFRVDETNPTRQEPIFRVPFAALAQSTMASVSVGLVRRALDEFMTVVAPTDPVVCHGIAKCVGASRAAASYLAEAVDEVWDRCCGERPPDAKQRTALQLAACHAVATASRVGDHLRARAGMSVLPHNSVLGRAVADLHAVTQNTLVSDARFTDVGRAL